MSGPQLRVPGQARPSAPGKAADERARELVGDLFPESASASGRLPDLPRWAFLLLQLAALALGTVMLLARISGVPAWHIIYAEDLGIYLPGALAHPWHLLASYGGYLQLVPRLIAQLVSLLPIQDAAVGFAVGGAIVASGCGVFAYHASAGHVSSRWLRAVIGLSVVLLPVAQLEIADNGVNSLWYLLVALFWAILWRPPTRAGVWVAGVVAFFAAASTSLALIFVPLLAARVLVLPRRIREQGVTVGWAAGSLLQVLVILTSHLSRTTTGKLANVPPYLTHYVILPALGWHLSWELRDAIGVHDATLLMGGILAVVLCVIVITQATRCRVFVVTAVGTGLVFVVVGAGFAWGGPDQLLTVAVEHGARYSTVPILLLDAALIVAADACARRWWPRPQAVAAVAVLVAILAVGWVWDFRYPVARVHGTAWTATADTWLRQCQGSPAGSITVTFPDYWSRVPLATTFSCASLHR
jgi:hypothetical protein